MNGAMFAPRMAALSLGVLGVMGAMLALTGIFGLAAYSVSKRLKELGIRTLTQAVPYWFGPRTVAWNFGEPLTSFGRVPGDLPRSASSGRCGCGNDAGRFTGHLDSRATCLVG
jgi:hypothetical protein